MFDFASPWRTEGDRDGINDKGLVSYDRKTRKDAFYLYQANWSDSPVLHLLARRDDQRRIPETVLRYYTNLENVTITLNGEKLGAAETYGPRAFVIKGVTLRPGSNLIEAHGRTSDGKPVGDRINWTLAEAVTGNASPE
jgi:beta-galactosidase